jgi:preprotein translocase subunit YajC
VVDERFFAAAFVSREMFELASFFARGILFADQQAPAGSTFFAIAPFIVIGLLFYFIVLRPERRRQLELKKMIGSLKKNDRVVTVGGIHGTVANASQDSDEIILKVDEATNTKLRVSRTAIARVLAGESSIENKEPT